MYCNTEIEIVRNSKHVQYILAIDRSIQIKGCLLNDIKHCFYKSINMKLVECLYCIILLFILFVLNIFQLQLRYQPETIFTQTKDQQIQHLSNTRFSTDLHIFTNAGRWAVVVIESRSCLFDCLLALLTFSYSPTRATTEIAVEGDELKKLKEVKTL